MKQKQKAEIWKTEIRLARRLISTFAPRWRLRAESYFLHFCFSPVVDFCFLLSTFLIFPSSSSSSSWGIGDGSWKMGDGSAIFSLRSSNFHLPRLKAEIGNQKLGIGGFFFAETMSTCVLPAKRAVSQPSHNRPYENQDSNCRSSDQ